jgi:hypothetical protein
MLRNEFKTIEEFAGFICRLERQYTDKIFYALYKNAGNIQSWYNEPNKVRDAWAGKMTTSPRDQSEAWDQVGEIVFSGVLYREFMNWFPVGLPIGSEVRMESEDAVIHIDVKTHKEGDSDLDRTQDVRPEQISTDEQDTYVSDQNGNLGDCPPRLPPYYTFGPNLLKVTISGFIICAYRFDPKDGHQYLTRIQLFTVPNGVLRAHCDYRDIFQAGKDGRAGHRYRINLPALANHEAWRWREIKYEPYGFVVTR